MPRKRTTRAQTTRAKPKLKAAEDDEVANEMTAEEKKGKLASIIKDFDCNLDNIRTQYDEELEALQKEIEKHFYHMRCKLSSMELQMTVEKYIEFTMSEEEDSEDTDTMPASRSTSAAEPSSLQNSKTALSKYRSRIETIPEEGGAGGPQTATKRGRKRTAANKGQGVTFNAEPLSTIQNNFITPATHRNITTTGWGATPLVTPKFDPRLPITPANSRRVKPGEVAMSLAGSPLNVENNNNRSRTIVLNNGEEIDVEIPDRADINSLMSTLRNIMKKGQDAQT